MATIQIDDKLLLRPHELADAEALFAAVDRDRSRLGLWLPWVATTTRQEHSVEFIKRSNQQIQDQQSLPLGIFYDGVLIGGVGMHEWKHECKLAQVGYWITKEYEGRGITSASISALLTYLFKEVGLNKAEIRFAVANARSASVAQRLGFITEGIIRQAAPRNGMLEDLVVTGMLKTEWLQRQQ